MPADPTPDRPRATATSDAPLRLRAGLRAAPVYRRGTQAVYLLRDSTRGATVSVSAALHAVVTDVLDGYDRAGVEARQLERGGAALNPDRWSAISAALAGRNLLADERDTASERGTAAEQDTADAPSGPAGSALWIGSWRMGRIALPRTPMIIERTCRMLRPVLNRWGAAATLAVIIVAATLIAASGSRLLADAADAVRDPLVVLVAILALWAGTLAHEVAHGIVARSGGATVSEIGVFWRLPLVIPYCRVPDLLFVRSRAVRVGTSLAGCVLNLLVAVPFAALWLWSDASFARELSALVCPLSLLVALVNLLPVGSMDGAKALGHAFDLLGVPGEAARLHERARHEGAQRHGDTGHYDPTTRRVLRAAHYLGPASLVAFAALALAFAWGVGRHIASDGAVLLVLAVVLAVVGLVVVTVRRRRARAADRARREQAAPRAGTAAPTSPAPAAAAP